ncbi:MAG: L-threonine 3-dehydrogenase [Spirochaetes bacterium]|nr:L-threonine 3-dehydrogenase [Spirochaetota bacterium]
MKTMKALVKREPAKGLWLEEVPVPELGINDVLIKIEKTAICGTDLHIYNWDHWSQKTIKTPMVIGHEYVGRVVAFGSNVHDLYEGEIVSGEGHIVCGHCRNCMAGRRHLCPNTQGVGVHRNGAFAEYLCIPRSNVWVCDPKIPTDIIACFDPFGNAVHTALTFNVLGEDVLITGAGPIGIMAIPVVKHAGARHVVITDVNPYRLELAKKMNPTKVVDVTKESLTDVMEDLYMTEGFDVGLEMSGNASALRDMIHHMFNGGSIALLGILANDAAIDWDAVIFESLTLKGIYGRRMYETWYKMTALLQTGVDISPIITHCFHYSEFGKAFDLMNTGNSGKVILNWD